MDINNHEKFDNFDLFQIIKFSKYYPDYTLEELEKYISKYKDDCVAYTFYLKILIDKMKIKEAKKLIEFIETKYPNFEYIDFAICKVRYYMFIGEYEHAKAIYDKYKDKIVAMYPNDSIFEIVYAKLTSKEMPIEAKNHNYFASQINDYSYDKFLKHIERHLANYNMDKKNPNPAVFSCDFPLERVLEEIKALIPNEERMFYNYFDDYYVFKFDEAGRVDYESVNYIRVIAIHDTNQILTMYPMISGSALPYIDINYLKEENEKPKVRRLSMTEKFYKKYGNIDKE